MASYFDEIAKNRLKSLILMFIFGLFFFAIIYVLVIFLGGGIFALTIAALLVIIYAAISFFFGSFFVVKTSGAQEVSQKDYPVLYEIIEGLAAAMQLPMPKVCVTNDPSPNAFATGRDKGHSYVVVTSGLLAIMNKQEIEGVLAHEMSHIADSDIQYMLVAVVFAGAIGLIAALIRNTLFFGGIGNAGRGRRDDNGIILIIAIVLGILAPLIAMLLRLAISRKREFMADANGARITRDPKGLASALKKISAYEKNPNTRGVMRVNEITSSLYFSSPLKASSITNLFSTHPPIEERIKILEQMY